MRILYWAPQSGVYTDQVMGAGPHIRGVINALRAKGHRVVPVFGGDVLSAAQEPGRDGSLLSKALRLKHGLKRLIPTSLKNDLRTLALNRYVYAKAVEAIDQRSPDVIYERSAYLNADGLKLANRFGIPYVLESDPLAVELGNLEWGSMLGFYADRLEQRKHAAAGAIMVSSQYAKRVVVERRRVHPDKVHVKELGVDVEFFDASKANGEAVRRKLRLEDKVVVGYHGSFRRHHGVDLLLEVARQFDAAGDRRVAFLMVGGGGLEGEYRAFATRHGLDSVVFTGIIREELPDYLSAMDIGVVPHARLHTLYPIKLLEYGAVQRPVIAPSLGVFEGVLEHGVTSWLVEPDSIEALAEAIQHLAGDPSLRKSLGEKFYQHVRRNFTWDKVADRMTATMAQCIARE